MRILPLSRVNIISLYIAKLDKSKGGEKQNMKNIVIVLAALMAVGIMFSGVALAAQTSHSLNVTGNAFSDVDYKMSTPAGLPYEKNDYSLNVFIVGGKDVAHTHYLDVGYDVEAETSLKANEKNTAAVVWIDESTRRDVIGDTVVNENVTSAQCYSGSVGYSAVANYLDFASTARVTETDIDYAVTAAGNGNMRWVSEEYLASGEIIHYVDNSNESDTNEEDIPMPGEGELSTFWTSMYAKEDVRANGVFEFEGSYHSEFSNFPAPAPDEEVGKMCPFGKEWN